MVHLVHGRTAGKSILPRGTAGLPVASVVKCAEPYTLFKTQLEAPSGTLSVGLMRRVDAALATAVGLQPPSG